MEQLVELLVGGGTERPFTSVQDRCERFLRQALAPMSVEEVEEIFQIYVQEGHGACAQALRNPAGRLPSSVGPAGGEMQEHPELVGEVVIVDGDFKQDGGSAAVGSARCEAEAFWGWDGAGTALARLADELRVAMEEGDDPAKQRCVTAMSALVKAHWQRTGKAD